MSTHAVIHSSRLRRTLINAVSYTALVLFALLVIVPLYWMIVSSLRTPTDVLSFPLDWRLRDPQWQNYPTALGRFPFDRYIFNSLLTSLSIAFLNVVICTLAGYSLAKYRYAGRMVLFVVILATMMLPFEVIMVPMFLVVKTAGWLNSYQGMIIPLAVDAFGIFLMRQYMLSVPDALIEAARIDGAGELRILTTIVLPLAKPAVVALTIFSFRESWDLYIWPLIIVTRDNLRTLTLGIARFDATLAVRHNEIMAVAVVGMIPMVLLFFFLQRSFIQGIAISGLRE